MGEAKRRGGRVERMKQAKFQALARANYAKERGELAAEVAKMSERFGLKMGIPNLVEKDADGAMHPIRFVVVPYDALVEKLQDAGADRPPLADLADGPDGGTIERLLAEPEPEPAENEGNVVSIHAYGVDDKVPE